MACDFEVFFNLNQYDAATEATLTAFQRIDELEAQLSFYQPESEISSLNRSQGRTLSVSEELRQILTQSEALHQETQGAFDITSTPLSQVWGFRQRNATIPTQQQIDDALETVDASKIKIDESGVRLACDSLQINLNSIGKGYALDQAADLIRGFRIDDFVIHGGQSSVVARGNESKSNSHLNLDEDIGWTVGLSHPYVPNQRLLEISLKNESLSTSGTARQGFFHQGRRYGHILDPRTGWPTDHFLSTTVISPSAATSDALATAFFVMSLDEVTSYCDKHLDVGAILLIRESNSGKVSVETFNIDEASIKRF